MHVLKGKRRLHHVVHNQVLRDGLAPLFHLRTDINRRVGMGTVSKHNNVTAGNTSRCKPLNLLD